MDMKYTKEEMFKDYEQVKYATTLAEKKEVAAKYGIDSKKAADIQKGILEQMREDRKTRSEFDLNDVRAYSILSDCPERYDKIVMWLSKESRAFVEYLADFYYEDLVKKGLVERFNVEEPITTKGYAISPAYKYAINRYAYAKKFLRESTDEFKAAKEEHENQIGAIRAKLDEQMQEFRTLYIERTVSFAGRKWDFAQKNIDLALNKYYEYFEKAKKFESDLYAQGMKFYDIRSNEELKRLAEIRDFAWGEYMDYKGILHYSKDEYLKIAEQNAKDIYERNTTVLAEKVNKWNVSVDQMQVAKVADDPKFFELEVTDGTHKIYARSIWAAEYSTLVTPHFRFIITERK